MPRKYSKSVAALRRAENVIPLGSQTFSKSKIQYPVGAAPLFMDRALGCRTWDVDGNSYIDLVNSLGAVTLGYSDPEVNEAVQKQLSIGAIFSQPHVLEAEVAELVSELIPGAERVRFGKTGSDATTAAVRLARAVTGRDLVLVGGYHGWHDWYIGSTSMNRGVPDLVRQLTHRVDVTDPESVVSLLERFPHQFAAIILEPCGPAGCDPENMRAIVDLVRGQGTLVILDEVVTGFRVSKRGAQPLLGIDADLICLGKGMANGLPLSAVAGRRDLMEHFETVFFSGTFGGECLSLAAARVTLSRVKDDRVTDSLRVTGTNFMNLVNAHLGNSRIPAVVTGHPAWSFLIWEIAEPNKLWEVKTLMVQELAARGVLSIGSHLPSAAFEEDDIEEASRAYCEALTVAGQAIEADHVTELLAGPVLKPLFSVRD